MIFNMEAVGEECDVRGDVIGAVWNRHRSVWRIAASFLTLVAANAALTGTSC